MQVLSSGPCPVHGGAVTDPDNPDKTEPDDKKDKADEESDRLLWFN